MTFMKSRSQSKVLKATAIALLLGLATVSPSIPSHASDNKGVEQTVKLQQLAIVDLQVTKVIDFGTAMADILTGKVAPPPQGARINVEFTGSTKGVLSGKMTGTDFLNIRADGRIELNIQAVIVTPEGDRISYEAGGVSVPGANGIGVLRETAKLTTSSEKYAWVNGHTFLSEGTINTTTGKVDLILYK